MDFKEFIKEKLKDKLDIDNFIKEADEAKLDLEEYLYRIGKLDDSFLEAKGEFYKLPIKKFLQDEKISKDTIRLLDKEFAKKNRIIAFDKKGNEIYLGVVNPKIQNFDEIINFIKKTLNLEPKIFLISIKDFYRSLKQYEEFPETLKNLIFQIREKKPPVAEEKFVSLEQEILPSEEAPIIKLVQSLIEEAVFSNASDIHIEPLMHKTRIRFRIFGDLNTIAYLPKDIHNQIVNRIKVLAQLRLDETRIPQDGRIRVLIEGREIDLRIGVLPTVEGEKVAIRILDPLIGLKQLEGLGLNDYSIEKLNIALKKPHGLILITGPTGSGKTTTLYAILQKLNKENVNIISLEDPVEYRIEGVNQSQVRPEIKYTFATGLREILRQDPNIILVGEIRDLETAELAIHASLTGHIVLSTLHTNNAIGAITRLVDLGVERFLLPPTLRLIIAQRLGRRLCDDCKKPIDPPKEILDIIEENLKDIPKEILDKYVKKPYKIYRAEGCEKCGGKGYTGRIGIFEIILLTKEIEDAIYQGKSELEILELLKKQNFINLRQDGIIKALNGLITFEEAVKLT
jgi:type IV pilus assembly protein PilB